MDFLALSTAETRMQFRAYRTSGLILYGVGPITGLDFIGTAHYSPRVLFSGHRPGGGGRG